MKIQDLLLGWLNPRLNDSGLNWLLEKSESIKRGAPDRMIFTAFSSAARFSGKDPLALEPADLSAAKAAIPDWSPLDWTCDQAARAVLLLSLPAGATSANLIKQLYQTADMEEATAMQKSLAVLPNPELHMAWAREGIRSNIQQVFEALAVRNPYPALHFDEIGWNQLIVKTFFVGTSLLEVVGLDKRVNPRLARMLTDLAHERWAAGRQFSPDLWRCVGPCADSEAMEDLHRILGEGSLVEKRAAALALNASPAPGPLMLRDMDPGLSDDIRSGKLNWENFNHGI